MAPIVTAPIVKQVTVALDLAAAFELFTAGMSDWWPLDAEHSIFGSETVGVAFEGRVAGRIYEYTQDGREGSWGVVKVWEPPERAVFSWNPNPDRDDSRSTEIEVRFQSVPDGTVLTLEHRAWERLGDEAAGLRPGYESGWDLVLGRFAASATS